MVVTLVRTAAAFSAVPAAYTGSIISRPVSVCATRVGQARRATCSSARVAAPAPARAWRGVASAPLGGTDQIVAAGRAQTIARAMECARRARASALANIGGRALIAPNGSVSVSAAAMGIASMARVFVLLAGKGESALSEPALSDALVTVHARRMVDACAMLVGAGRTAQRRLATPRVSTVGCVSLVLACAHHRVLVVTANWPAALCNAAGVGQAPLTARVHASMVGGVLAARSALAPECAPATGNATLLRRNARVRQSGQEMIVPRSRALSTARVWACASAGNVFALRADTAPIVAWQHARNRVASTEFVRMACASAHLAGPVVIACSARAHPAVGMAHAIRSDLYAAAQLVGREIRARSASAQALQHAQAMASATTASVIARSAARARTAGRLCVQASARTMASACRGIARAFKALRVLRARRRRAVATTDVQRAARPFASASAVRSSSAQATLLAARAT